MKVFLQFLILCSLVLTFSVFGEQKSISLTGHPDYPPVIWFSKKDNTLKGMAVEIVQEMFSVHGIKVELVPLSTWGRALEEVSQARVDLVLPPYKTDERLRTYLFSEKPFLMDRTVLFIKKGKKIKYETPLDLKKLKGVAIINDSFGDDFDLAAKKYLNIQRLSKTSQSLRFLLRGRADYLIAGYSAGVSVAIKEGLINDVEIVSNDIITTGMFLAISKNSKWATPDTMKIINQYISEKISSSKLKLLEEKYLEIYAKE